MICSTLPRRRRSSRMYCITGLPATLSIGFGVMYVCGRSRVPLPASGMMTFMPRASWGICRACVGGALSRRARAFASVASLNSHDVIELGSARLEHVVVGDGFHVVHGSWRYAER